LNQFTREARKKKRQEIRRESMNEARRKRDEEALSLLHPDNDEILEKQQMLWQFEPIQQQPVNARYSVTSRTDVRMLREQSVSRGLSNNSLQSANNMQRTVSEIQRTMSGLPRGPSGLERAVSGIDRNVSGIQRGNSSSNLPAMPGAMIQRTYTKRIDAQEDIKALPALNRSNIFNTSTRGLNSRSQSFINKPTNVEHTRSGIQNSSKSTNNNLDVNMSMMKDFPDNIQRLRSIKPNANGYSMVRDDEFNDEVDDDDDPKYISGILDRFFDRHVTPLVNRVQVHLISLVSSLSAKCKIPYPDFLTFYHPVTPKSIFNRNDKLSGAWRINMKIDSRIRSLYFMNQRIIEELRLARREFVLDDELTIVAMDSTITASGLFMLICQYRYETLYYSIIILLEMTAFAIIGSWCKLYTAWDVRVYILSVLLLMFWLLSVCLRPYTEEVDGWFDLFGRLIIAAIGIGSIIIDSKYPSFSFPSDSSSKYIITHYTDLAPLTYLIFDIFFCLAFYIYIVSVFRLIGFFESIRSIYRDMTYQLSDMVLSFLITQMEKRIIGYENTFHGLSFLQQWDDIIQSQKRYFFLTLPDLRPPSTLPFFTKIFYLNIAAMLDLSVRNLHSSLGLTLLHASMCNASTEISKWLIASYPDLLHVHDSQRDTPILLALKEFAYYLILYSEQNGGKLDDDTSYSDDAYNLYYPEIESIRNEVIITGEFSEEHSIATELTAKDLNFIITNGYSNLSTSQDQNVENYSFSLQQKGHLIKKHQQEKESVFQRRFPEDDSVDDYESGQMISWKILGWNVPEVNLYMDSDYYEMLIDHEKALHYYQNRQQLSTKDEIERERQEGLMSSKNAHHHRHQAVKMDWNDNDHLPVNQRFKTPKSYLDSETSKPADHEQQVSVPPSATKAKYPKDLQFGIPTNKRILMIPTNLLPMSHIDENRFADWADAVIREKKQYKKMSLLRKLSHRIFSKHHLFTHISSHEQDEGDTTKSVTDRDSSTASSTASFYQREVVYQLCKFTEIFFSKEIEDNSSKIEWDISAYKSMESTASAQQARVAQHLAMVLHLNPPAGFAKISDWSLKSTPIVYDHQNIQQTSTIVQGSVAVVSTIESTLQAVKTFLPNKLRTQNTTKENKTFSIDDVNALDDYFGGEFSDRMIHYLSEALVSVRGHINLSDMELSVYGRKGWRGLARACRRSNSSYLQPSLFVGMKQFALNTIDVSRNELDDGDAVLVAEILLYQHTTSHLNLSYNRIGAKGVARICHVLKHHESIRYVNLSHNFIGPTAGKDLGTFLKNTTTLTSLDLSHNLLGDIVVFPTLSRRQMIPSAAKDLCQGIKQNKSLFRLDLAYNRLGSLLANYLPAALLKHPNLCELNISGNMLGPKHGPIMIYTLAGEYAGEKILRIREKLYQTYRRENSDRDVNSSSIQHPAEGSSIKKNPSSNPNKKNEKVGHPICLTSLSIADNQLGDLAGYAIGTYIRHNSSLTALDISCNSLGHVSGEAITDALERSLSLSQTSKNFIQNEVGKMEEMNYQLQSPRYREKSVSMHEKKVIRLREDIQSMKCESSSLIYLNLAHNNLGPKFFHALMNCVSAKNATITSLDVSNNPLGYSVHKAGDADQYLTSSSTAGGRTLVQLNLENTFFSSTQLVNIMSGLLISDKLAEINLSNCPFDEPTCFQCSYVLKSCLNLRSFNLANCQLGPKGGMLLLTHFATAVRTGSLVHVNLNGNFLSSVVATILGKALALPECKIRVLYLARNDLLSQGCELIIRGLLQNTSVEDLDLSQNFLNESIAESISLLPRGVYNQGEKISESPIRRLNISMNPEIGAQGARLIFMGLINSVKLTHIDAKNIGMKGNIAGVISSALRDPAIRWQVLDISENDLSKNAVNEIFWALRLNRHLRVLNLAKNPRIGPIFGTDEDALLRHGISIVRCIQSSNITLREINLSSNFLMSNACINILEACIDNYTIKRLNLSANHFDDEIADKLSEFLRFNHIVDMIDLSHNQLGYKSLFAVCEGLVVNHRLKALHLDHNDLGNAGMVTADSFIHAMTNNHILRILTLDSNRFGADYLLQTIPALLARNACLQQLSLCDNRLDAKAGRFILEAYKHSSTLVELGLTRDEIGSEVWEDFVETSNRKKNMIFYQDDIALTLATGLEDEGTMNAKKKHGNNQLLKDIKVSRKLDDDFMDGYHQLQDHRL
jgi:Ran GTPase-activating protein (RanGAP) involved in mRNA processing and transport